MQKPQTYTNWQRVAQHHPQLRKQHQLPLRKNRKQTAAAQSITNTKTSVATTPARVERPILMEAQKSSNAAMENNIYLQLVKRSPSVALAKGDGSGKKFKKCHGA